MGLDNGIYVTGLDMSKAPYDFLKVRVEEEIEKPDFFSICYWRKFWSFRDRVVEKLEKRHPGYEYEYPLEYEDYRMILKEIMFMMDRRNWDEDLVEALWTYEEAQQQLIYDYCAVLWLFEQYCKDHSIKAYFYDSY